MNIKMTKLIHESTFSDNPVTDNRYHGITSLLRMQVCQSHTLELHYKDRQLKFTLDTGVTASLIKESICRFSGIPILPATQRFILTNYWRNEHLFKLRRNTTIRFDSFGCTKTWL